MKILINENFINIVKTLNPINKNDINIVKIIGDGNCFYQCLFFFPLGNKQFYAEIKNEIIKLFENNREAFNEFLEMTMPTTKVKRNWQKKNIIT